MDDVKIGSPGDRIAQTLDLCHLQLPRRLRKDGVPMAELAHTSGHVLLLPGQPLRLLSLDLRVGKKYREYKGAGIRGAKTSPDYYRPVDRLKDMNAGEVYPSALYPHLGSSFVGGANESPGR